MATAADKDAKAAAQRAEDAEVCLACQDSTETQLQDKLARIEEQLRVQQSRTAELEKDLQLSQASSQATSASSELQVKRLTEELEAALLTIRQRNQDLNLLAAQLATVQSQPTSHPEPVLLWTRRRREPPAPSPSSYQPSSQTVT